MEPLREDDPATLGPFTLRARLGAGGMGVVYLAGNADGLEVAVKTVPRGVGADVRIRLRREAELLATVDHPRIARFVDADADAEEPWLAMRYIPGPSLADANLPLPRQQLRQLADGLAEALAALHRLGVTHRDVKPGNVIMTSVGAVLVDLGIAITADAASMTMAGTAVGSPAWMAPEQFAGDSAGPPADVWGWAAVLTYAATGREPFGAGTIAALAQRIMSRPPDLRDVPEWLRGAVSLAFTKQPEDRPKAFDLIRGGRARLPNAAAVRRRTAPPVGPRTAPSGRSGFAPPTFPTSGSVGDRPSGPVPGPSSGPVAGPSSGPVAGPSSGPGGRHPSGPVGRHPSGPLPGTGFDRTAPATSPGPARAARHGAPGGRRRLSAGLIALIIAVALVVAGVVAWLTTRGGSDAAGPSKGSSSQGATRITNALLKRNGLCADGCTITGRVPFTHPRWGKVTLVSAQPAKDGRTAGSGVVAVIDAGGTGRWHYQVRPVTRLAPAKDPADTSGNLFLTYQSGGMPGVIVVGPTTDGTGMNDYSTVPNAAVADDARFFDATLSKVDGRYRILKRNPGCGPCAATTYVWNTVNYVVR